MSFFRDGAWQIKHGDGGWEPCNIEAWQVTQVSNWRIVNRALSIRDIFQVYYAEYEQYETRGRIFPYLVSDRIQFRKDSSLKLAPYPYNVFSLGSALLLARDASG